MKIFGAFIVELHLYINMWVFLSCRKEIFICEDTKAIVFTISLAISWFVFNSFIVLLWLKFLTICSCCLLMNHFRWWSHANSSSSTLTSLWCNFHLVYNIFLLMSLFLYTIASIWRQQIFGIVLKWAVIVIILKLFRSGMHWMILWSIFFILKRSYLLLHEICTLFWMSSVTCIIVFFQGAAVRIDIWLFKHHGGGGIHFIIIIMFTWPKLTWWYKTTNIS